jgi:uncharacterized protein (TIGR04255 family)
MNKPTSEAEVYPNAPLVEVVCEIRFGGELTIEARRHEFRERIRTEYPKLLVPKSGTDDRPLLLQHYRFRSDDDERTVLLAPNSFGLSVTRYEGYRAFFAEYMRLHKMFGETFPEVGKLNRVGWRYVNIIPFVRAEGLIPIGDFLKLDLQLPEQIPNRYEKLDLNFTALKTNDDSVIMRLASVQKSTGDEGLLLDLDYGKKGDSLQFNDVKGHLSDGHDHCKALFENLITTGYRQYLRGEQL